MKKLTILFAVLLLITVSCRKRKEDVSHTVTVPTAQVKGEKFITINVGGAVPADEGATIINDEPVSGGNTIMAVENNIDVNTPGIYYMLYQTKTKNGYMVGTARYVAVTNYQDATDLSGDYLRAATGVVVSITKQSRGLYKNSDMGGAGLSDALYFAVINDSTIDAGPQFSESLGTVIDASKESLDISGSDVTIRYALDAPGYGTSVRTFERQ